MPTAKEVKADYLAGKYKCGHVLNPTPYDAIVLLDVDTNGDYVAGYYEKVGGEKKFFCNALRYGRVPLGANTYCEFDYHFWCNGEKYGIGQCGWSVTDNV
jgi:hypothetical protein